MWLFEGLILISSLLKVISCGIALFEYWVAAVLLATAGFTFEAGPYGVELADGGLHQLRFIGEDAGFEVTVPGTFHADASPGEVRGPYIGHLADRKSVV